MLTNEDRAAIDGLFNRLAEAQQRSGPRDADAEALIHERIARQPHAPYYLAQTVVVQQEALKQAERRIEELEAAGRQTEQRRGPWGNTQPASAYDRGGVRNGGWGGGGFLSGAMQTALGVAGGVMLGNFIGSMFSAGSANAAETADSSDQADSGDDAGATDTGGSEAGSDAGSDAGGFDGGDFGGGDF